MPGPQATTLGRGAPSSGLASGATERPTLQQRLERHWVGRALICAFLAVTLAAVAVVNLPDSPVQRSILTVGAPYLNALGLDQNWGVFAPDGRQAVIRLEAEVRYADGSMVVWHPPEAGPVLGAYWDYRWRKWVEWVIAPEGNDTSLWRSAAMFVAREVARPGKQPAQVTLVAYQSDLSPPGAARDRGPWKRSVLYTLPLRAR